MTERPFCCYGPCAAYAAYRMRILPRKTPNPLCFHVRQALDGLGGSEPVWVYSCSMKAHGELVRWAAQVVLDFEHLSDEVKQVRLHD